MQLSTEQQLLLDQGRQLPVMESFYTIQGEGRNSGMASFFLRVGGCDVGCYWCDVKESWNPAIHPLRSVDDVVEEALKYPARSVVVTGGEPLLYSMDYLTSAFKNAGFKTFIETSGSSPLSGSWDWICLSPKPLAPPLGEIIPLAHELKVIVFEDADFAWAESFASRVHSDCKKLLQPEWSRREKIMPAIVRFIMDHPDWMVSLQSHKYMHIP